MSAFQSVVRKAVRLSCLAACAICPALEAGTVKLPPKDKFFLVLLAGQSNMAGRGKVMPEDKIPRKNVLMLNKKGEWEPAVSPVHFDVSWAGVGPGETFGELLAASAPGVTVGLIPAACGGSSIRHWQPGAYWKQTDSHPYDDALARTERALRDGTLKAILWHQGESDCYPGKAEDYYSRLRTLLMDFRSRFNAPDVPVIIGQLPRFYHAPWNESARRVDAAHRQAAAECQPALFVSSEGMTANPDKIHLDRASQIEFGRRYFEAYMKLVRPDRDK